MKLEGARRDGNSLVLETKDAAAWRFLISFKPGEYEITKKREKRSLDANAYAWCLLGKLAEALRMPVNDVYRDEIRKIGGTSEIVCVQNAALDALVRVWESRGLGWQAEAFPSKVDGCTNVRLHYGSSAYDTHQMSIFIDQIIQDCKSLDIETLPPWRIEMLLEAWDARKD